MFIYNIWRYFKKYYDVKKQIIIRLGIFPTRRYRDTKTLVYATNYQEENASIFFLVSLFRLKTLILRHGEKCFRIFYPRVFMFNFITLIINCL